MEFDHISQLGAVQAADKANVVSKDRSYGASWKKRGGIGAFMMAARKWDRIEVMMQQRGYDIFAGIAEAAGDRQGIDGTVLAEIRDLRRYLTLIEAQMVAVGAVVIRDDLTDYVGAESVVSAEKPEEDVSLAELRRAAAAAVAAAPSPVRSDDKHTLHSGPAKVSTAPARGASALPRPNPKLHSVVVVESDLSQRRWTLQKIHSDGMVDLHSTSGQSPRHSKRKHHVSEIVPASTPTQRAAAESDEKSQFKFSVDDVVLVRLRDQKYAGKVEAREFSPLSATPYTYTVVTGKVGRLENIPESELFPALEGTVIG